MGKVKELKKVQETEIVEVPLKDEEFNYVMNISQARNNINNEHNRMISAFLHYVAVNRGVAEATDNLKFELDFDDEKRILKLEKLEDSFYKEEETKD